MPRLFGVAGGSRCGWGGEKFSLQGKKAPIQNEIRKSPIVVNTNAMTKLEERRTGH